MFRDSRYKGILTVKARIKAQGTAGSGSEGSDISEIKRSQQELLSMDNISQEVSEETTG